MGNLEQNRLKWRFNQHSHTASDALANSGMCSCLDATIAVPTKATSNCLPPKQRRLSGPNNLRLKRKKSVKNPGMLNRGALSIK